MDRSIRNLLGLTNDIKRVYQFSDKAGEVSREEFEYSQIVHNVVFGEKGYVDTLGPTWNMVHDPRFLKIEGCFVVDRPAIFGGDARLGKQFISDSGLFTSTVNDLEQYSEILGEGRHFEVTLRNMRIERALREATETGIHTESPQPMLGRKFKNPVIASEKLIDFGEVSLDEALATYKSTKKPHGALWIYETQLTEDEKATVGALSASYTDLDPHEFHLKNSDEAIWAFLRHEDNVPNYFSKEDDGNKPNRLAKTLHASIKIGLISLVADYAPIANVQEWVTLETGDLVEEAQMTDAEIPRVWLEVDLLEKALTQRAVLRVTAAKILNHQDMRRHLRRTGIDAEKLLLTDVERDTLLRTIYESDYPTGIEQLFLKVSLYVNNCTMWPIEDREKAQLAQAREDSRKAISALQSGETLPITRYTEPQIDLPETPEERLTKDIMDNPLRLELFVLFTQCEKNKLEEAANILRRAATDPDFVVDEPAFIELLEATREWIPETTLEELDGMLATDEEKAAGFAGNHEV